jgi:hypothetical protein
MNQYFTSYSPKHRVIIKDLKTGNPKDLGGAGKGDISDDLVSLSTNKAYGRAAGTWQVMLTYRIVKDGLRYHELIQPDDMITIELDAGDGNGLKPVMLGLVDRVSRVRQIGADGRPVRQVKLSGQDMGKLLMVHDIGWDIKKEELKLTEQPDDQAGPPKPKPMRDLSRKYNQALQTGTSEKMITNLYEYTFMKPMPDVASYFWRRFKTDDSWVIDNPNIYNLRGVKLWEAMKRAEHHPYNILTTDTDLTEPDKFWVILEKQPIKDTGKLNKDEDQFYKIDETQIIGDDIGISDAERINFLFYNPAQTNYATNYGSEVLSVHPELVQHDPESIKLHGYCLKTFTDSFVPPSMTNINQPPDSKSLHEMSKLTKLFWSWFKDNHTYESGSFHIHLRPDIRVGNGLLVKQVDTDIYKEYLIEQVAHQYVVWPQPQFTTTLHVTRGQWHESPPPVAQKAATQAAEPPKPEPPPPQPPQKKTPVSYKGSKGVASAAACENFRKQYEALEAKKAGEDPLTSDEMAQWLELRDGLVGYGCPWSGNPSGNPNSFE